MSNKEQYITFKYFFCNSKLIKIVQCQHFSYIIDAAYCKYIPINVDHTLFGQIVEKFNKTQRK